MFIKKKTKVACRMSGIEWGVVYVRKLHFETDNDKFSLRRVQSKQICRHRQWNLLQNSLWVWRWAIESKLRGWNWQKQQQFFDDLTTCGGPARLVSKLNWISTPPLSSLRPYTPVRPGRVQLEYVSSWTSSTSGIYGRFWALHGRIAWRIWRC